MMPFEVVWTEQSKDSLNRLQREDIIRVIRRVEAVKADPYRFLNKIVGERAWRLRVGDWRVLLDIDHEKNVLYVLEVGHRKNIYKNL